MNRLPTYLRETRRYARVAGRLLIRANNCSTPERRAWLRGEAYHAALMEQASRALLQIEVTDQART